eukprot:CAMPEP_0206448992 /NCGR_PEP_ID=MMETSP0324_2-20121206/17820_1 /ASSEMBLY_ACC=CAM_ASM_000836 /TAXON_ID=2866 /ORGANISM="Crypthecodinium cohnii, Strain Seligo" /LENGTH=575 /DNA_ID=CAMNT_0053918277 /DNA_START=290 /DNA_END=2017 /DNA_ORIENTATION=+
MEGWNDGWGGMDYYDQMKHGGMMDYGGYGPPMMGYRGPGFMPMDSMPMPTYPAMPPYSMEGELKAKYDEVKMSKEGQTRVKACMKALEEMVSSLGDGSQVRAFGSIGNGFERLGSDLDATCFREGKEQFTAADMRAKLLPILKEDKRFKVIEEIWGARIPIVKLRFEEALDVDLSSNNLEPLHNTNLLQAYTKMGQYVKMLGILIKLWASASGVSGAVNGNLSPYAFTLMVIYYMQVDPRVRLEVLPTEEYAQNDAPKDLKHPKWHCKLSLSELVTGFFRFYTMEFGWGTEVVSVRLGKRYIASDDAFKLLPGRTLQRLHVEDPFLLNRNLHCVLRQEQETLLYNLIKSSYDSLEYNKTLPEGLQCSANQDINAKLAQRQSSRLNPEAQAFDAGIAAKRRDVAPPARPPGHLEVPPAQLKRSSFPPGSVYSPAWEPGLPYEGITGQHRESHQITSQPQVKKEGKGQGHPDGAHDAKLPPQPQQQKQPQQQQQQQQQKKKEEKEKEKEPNPETHHPPPQGSNKVPTEPARETPKLENVEFFKLYQDIFAMAEAEELRSKAPDENYIVSILEKEWKL